MDSRSTVLDSELPPLPGQRDHKCTDLVWLGLFLLACAGQLYALWYATLHGDFRRMTHGFDYTGQMCGMEGLHKQSEFVFWCRSPSEGLVLSHPICVSSCPVKGNQTHQCFEEDTMQIVELPDYQTQPVFQYCEPVDADLRETLIRDTWAKDTSSYLIAAANEIRRAWLPLAISTNISIVVGFLYLLFLDKCARALVYASEALAVVTLLAGGICLMAMGGQASGVGVEGQADANMDLVIGACFLAASGIVLCIVVGTNKNIGMALGCIQATSECMFKEPTLLLEPFVSIVVKLMIACAYFNVLLALAATGEVSTGSTTNGVYREFAWSTEQQLLIFGSMIMLWWLLETYHAVCQYALTWTAQLWYFTPTVQGVKALRNCGVFRGYGSALRYHLGTLAFGGLLIGSTRLVRPVLRWLARVSHNYDSPMGACVGSCCGCCIRSYERWLRTWTKSAYMDVAITSSSFGFSAWRASELMGTEVPAVAMLNGAHTIFQISGLGFVIFFGTVSTFLMCSAFPMFNSLESNYYVRDIKAVTLAAAVISAMIGTSYMLVFDTVGDTILFCYATEQRRNESYERHRQPVQKSRRSGLFAWVFKLATDDTDSSDEESRITYAPEQLKTLIKTHTREDLLNASLKQGMDDANDGVLMRTQNCFTRSPCRNAW